MHEDNFMGNMFRDMEQIHNDMEKSFQQMWQPIEMPSFGGSNQFGAEGLNAFHPDGNSWTSRSFSNVSEQRQCKDGICKLVKCENGKCTESTNEPVQKQQKAQRFH